MAAGHAHQRVVHDQGHDLAVCAHPHRPGRARPGRAGGAVLARVRGGRQGRDHGPPGHVPPVRADRAHGPDERRGLLRLGEDHRAARGPGAAVPARQHQRIPGDHVRVPGRRGRPADHRPDLRRVLPRGDRQAARRRLLHRAAQEGPRPLLGPAGRAAVRGRAGRARPGLRQRRPGRARGAAEPVADRRRGQRAAVADGGDPGGQRARHRPGPGDGVRHARRRFRAADLGEDAAGGPRQQRPAHRRGARLSAGVRAGLWPVRARGAFRAERGSVRARRLRRVRGRRRPGGRGRVRLRDEPDGHEPGRRPAQDGADRRRLPQPLRPKSRLVLRRTAVAPLPGGSAAGSRSGVRARPGWRCAGTGSGRRAAAPRRRRPGRR